MCVNAGFRLWRGFTSQCLDIGGAGPGRGDRWVCPRCGVTFEPRQVALGAWQEVKGAAMSVNKALLRWCDRGDCTAGRKLKRMWL